MRRPSAALRRFTARAAHTGRSFVTDTHGAIAIAAAGVVPLLLLFGFGAVEFQRYSAVRSTVQDGLDAAALAVAKSNLTDPVQLEALGRAVLAAHMRSDRGLTLSSFKVRVENGVVVTDAAVGVSPIISDIFTAGQLQVRGHSEVLRESSGLEVALVLDTTGSMATNNRIGIAKTAAKTFIDKMSEANGTTTGTNPVRIGIVPFANTVNVGPASQAPGATWLDQNAQSPIHAEVFHRGETGGPLLTPQESWPTGVPNRFTLFTQLGVPWGGCVESRPAPFDVTDAGPSSAQPGTLFVPYFSPDEPDQVLNARTYNTSLPDTPPVQAYAYANSYVEDVRRALRGYSFNTTTGAARLGAPWPNFTVAGNDPATIIQAFYRYAAGNNDAAMGWRGVQGRLAKYAGGAANTRLDLTDGRGPNRGCAVRPMTRLSTNYAALKSDIESLTVGGPTNIPMGLAWGWHLVSPNMPFGASPASDTSARRVVVLMTDGDNSLWSPVDGDVGNMNRSEYGGAGYSWQNRVGSTSNDRTAALNARLALLCTNMRNAKITVYTIRVEVTGGSPDLLRNCATDPGMFFDVKQASELTTTFDKIARSIQNLRISK